MEEKLLKIDSSPVVLKSKNILAYKIISKKSLKTVGYLPLQDILKLINVFKKL